LRSGDIANLKFGNIDWENNRVSLVMQKTGKELALPLLEDVGLAVIDYLQNARPPSGSANVFVSHRPPFDGFTSGAVYNLVSRYIAKSGIEVPPMKKRGPHSFRHGLASKLLEEKVPLPVISEILGHSDSLSTSAYLRIDVEQLRMCALEVDEYVCD
jgi:integrase